MQRIDGNNVVVAQPVVAATVAPGYFDDAPAPGARTQITDDWCNQVQEEIVAAIADADIALNKATNTQLRDAIKAKIISDLTDTGSASNAHLRALIASVTSQASGAKSAVIASENAVASGANSGVIASQATCVANQTQSLVLAASNCVASGPGSIALGTKCELFDGPAIGGGYSAGAAILPTGANQNLKWKIEHVTGKGTFDGGVAFPNGANQISQSVTLAGETILAGASWNTDIANSKIAATSIILWNFTFSGGGAGFRLVPGHITVLVGHAYPSLYNIGAGDFAAGTIYINYMIINPA